MPHPLRTRFAEEILTEFLPPAKPQKKQKAIILCTGMPTSPSKNSLLRFWSNKGYWVFLPRYRGTWESDGIFLKESPHIDILDVINGITKKFTTINRTPQSFSPSFEKIHLIGSSFGGAAALLCSNNKLVSKVIALSPVVDWKAEGQDEPFDWFAKYVQKAFGQAYRFSINDWDRLQKTPFYNPTDNIQKINGKKICIIHSHNDRIIPIESIFEFQKKTNCLVWDQTKGGHLSTSYTMNFWHYRRIKKFLNS